MRDENRALSSLIALIVLTLAPNLLAGNMEKVFIMNTKITIVQDLRFPPYVRIEADIFNESPVDLSGEWQLRQQRGHLKLKQNGLEHITIYLWENLFLDTLKKSIEVTWVSDLDEITTDTLRIPLVWKKSIHRDMPLTEEWLITEMKRPFEKGPPVVSIFIPVPAKVLVVAYDYRLYPVDTLFNEEKFRGHERIPCVTDKIGKGDYTFVLFVNGVRLSSRKVVDPALFAPRDYFYGE